MTVFFGMLYAHLIADWLLQTEFQACGKSKGKFFNMASVSHGATHAVCLVMALWWTGAAIAWAFPIVLSHIFIDRRWPVTWWIIHVERTRPETLEALWWLPIAVDQVMHLTIIGIVALCQ